MLYHNHNSLEKKCCANTRPSCLQPQGLWKCFSYKHNFSFSHFIEGGHNKDFFLTHETKVASVGEKKITPSYLLLNVEF